MVVEKVKVGKPESPESPESRESWENRITENRDSGLRRI